MQIMKTEETVVKSKIKDILLDLNWGSISHDYFGKGYSWLYHKIEGKDTDGNPKETFTDEETQKLKEVLMTLAMKIEACAETL